MAKGNLLIMSKTGHMVRLLDWYTSIPSVLKVNEMFASSAKTSFSKHSDW